MEQKTFIQIRKFFKEAIAGTKWEGLVYTVGGCERDFLLGLPIKDIDLVVEYPNGGIEFANWLKDNGLTAGSVVTYEHYGTAMFRLPLFLPYEIEAVQTRKESYRDIESRNPVTAYGTIEEDAHRRDFTVNALYYNISKEELLDINGRSLEDLENKIIRASGEPDVIFYEDPLRILRAVRFANRLGFAIEPETYQGMERYANRLSIISQERITDEFSKIITGNNACKGLGMLSKLGIFPFVFPYGPNLRQDEYNYFIDHLELDGEAVFNKIENLPLNVAARLSFLHFFDGEKFIEELLKNMRHSNEMIRKVLFYNKHTDRLYTSSIRTLRLLAYDCGKFAEKQNLDSEKLFKNCLRLISVLNDFDMEVTTEKAFSYPFVKEMLSYKLPINGQDILDNFKIKPGPTIKHLLDECFKLAMNIPYLTKREFLIFLESRKLLSSEINENDGNFK